MKRRGLVDAERVGLHVEVGAELKRDLKMKALSRGVTLRELVEKVLLDWAWGNPMEKPKNDQAV